ncbi:MAG: Gfo/Idh/MocA family oxidoreductase [Clostridia bacterium]|nr:Gfo/Idh/MocA family oxidoreductase [Clostridia bacterium]
MKKIKIGIAGTRGMSTVMGLNAIEDVEITAMCDLDEQHLNEAADKIGVKNRYRIFDDMLESDIDAVIIATPMQCHVPQAIAALEAGKHVMCEVTAGVTMDELWWLCETVEKYKKIYMYAENYIYDARVQQVKNMVKSGVFGEPYYAEGMYLHNIGNLFVYPNGKTSWRSFWQCGKRGNFYPTHSVGPVMQWFPGDRITEISTFSPGVYNDLGLKQDSGTTTMCRTEKGKLLNIRVDCMSPRPHNMDFYQLQGTLGHFQSRSHGDDYDRVSFIGEDSPIHSMKWKKLEEYNMYMPERFLNATEEQKKAGHNGGDFFIVEDFINAIRTNTQPELDVYKACEWTAVGLLSELSVTNNGKTMYVPHFRPGAPLEDKKIILK